MFSPEIEGRRIGEARPEWEIWLDLARRVRPDLRLQLSYPSTQQLREEIAQVVPAYDGIQRLQKTGDQFQAGGRHLCENWVSDGGRQGAFPCRCRCRKRDSGGHVLRLDPAGKQFNSMVHAEKDAITGAMRDAVLMNATDAAELRLNEGDAVVLRNDNGTYAGRVKVVEIARRNLQVMWPEGNALLHRHKRSPESGCRISTRM